LLSSLKVRASSELIDFSQRFCFTSPLMLELKYDDYCGSDYLKRLRPVGDDKLVSDSVQCSELR